MGRCPDAAEKQGSSEQMWMLKWMSIVVRNWYRMDTHGYDYVEKTLALGRSHHLNCIHHSGEFRTLRLGDKTNLECGQGLLLESHGPDLDGPALIRSHLPVTAPRKMW